MTKEFLFKDQIQPLKTKVRCGMGSRVSFGDEGEFLVAQIATGKMALISLESGNRYVEPITVGDPTCLTSNEFGQISAFNNDYEVI